MVSKCCSLVVLFISKPLPVPKCTGSTYTYFHLSLKHSVHATMLLETRVFHRLYRYQNVKYAVFLALS